MSKDFGGMWLFLNRVYTFLFSKRHVLENDAFRFVMFFYEMPSSAEMLQRKAEYKEKERRRKHLEHEKARKERLRLIEEERIMQEERKKREFLQKENYRLEAERKLKEEQERERLN